MIFTLRIWSMPFRLLPVAAMIVSASLLSGCFLFIRPEKPCIRIEESRTGDCAHYRLSEDDAYSCMRIYLPESAGVNP